ncbi:MAG: ABC transporter permease [Candidatus Bathyarchaeota archaeon]|nr:MAG: ABC transporter permease [Candidatus Bathyarchaeota archaeon]
MSLEIQIIEIAARAIVISGTATFLAAIWGIPLGIIIGLRRFHGRSLVVSFFNAMLGMPTVALGLILYLIFSRSGPLGFLHLLYTPIAMILGQAVLVTPILISFVTSTVESVDPEIKDLAKTLGASETEASMAVLRESIGGVLLAIAASFNRAIAELGVALMLGGNLRGLTRVLTTSIALETTRGELMLGIALTIILLFIALTINFSMNILQNKVRSWLWR